VSPYLIDTWHTTKVTRGINILNKNLKKFKKFKKKLKKI